MTPFFICSLPRSRTAWLANFLTYGPSFCFHEPFVELAPQDLPYVFKNLEREYIGVSDSLCTVFIGDLKKMFPQAKLVVIRRPAEEVITSLANLNIPASDFILWMDNRLNYIEKEYDCLVIDYHTFDAVEIWQYLLPEVPVDLERYWLLENLKVTLPIDVCIRKGKKLLSKIGITLS